jgi:hypothetical protein
VPDGAGGWSMSDFMATAANISSFGEDVNGELYVVDQGGSVLQLAAP